MNIKKINFLSQQNTKIKIGTEEIEKVKEYLYLGYKIRLDKDNQTAEIPRRIGLSWTAFQKLGFILKIEISP